MPKYYIGSKGDDYWRETSATTLIGAKITASRRYQQAVGGAIKVGEEIIHPNGNREIMCVSVKHGYDKWQDSF